MVDQNIIKYVISGGFQNEDKQQALGGLPSHKAAGVIVSDSPLNLFDHVDLDRALAGEYQYLNVYVFGTATEIGDAVRFWFDRDTFNDENEFAWGFESETYAHRYHYEPHKYFNGSDYIDIADTAALDLLQFSVSCWFRTSEALNVNDMMLVNKGGNGGVSAGENMNYGIWFESDDSKLTAGFETTADVKYFSRSTSTTLNDGEWHHAVVTYDQVNVRLYVDGVAQTPTATTATPETNAKPLTLGKNSRDATRYFKGDLDEIRVWNNDLTAAEVTALYQDGTVPQESAIVYEQKFGDDNGSIIAQKIANINTAPQGVTFLSPSNAPEDPNVEFWGIPFRFNVHKTTGGIQDSGDSYFNFWIRRKIIAATGIPNSIDNAGIWITTLDLTRANTPQGGGTGGDSDIPDEVSNCTIFQFGDSDCNGVTDDLLDQAIKIDPHPVAFLVSGDVQYTSDPSCIIKRFSNRGLGAVVMPAMGNHDKFSWYSGTYKLPKSYYSRVVENIGIITMDSESSFSVGSSQYTWVEAELKKFRANTNIDWIIVQIHRMFYSAPCTHDDNEGGKTDLYFPLFDKYLVDIVYQAHQHNNQRSKQVIYKSGDPKVVDSNSNTYTKGKGRIVITSGSGGHDDDGSLYDITSSRLSTWNAFEDDSHNLIHSLQFSGTNNIICTGKFWNANNEVVDTFTIQ